MHFVKLFKFDIDDDDELDDEDELGEWIDGEVLTVLAIDPGDIVNNMLFVIDEPFTLFDLDDIGLTMQHSESIKAFEQDYYQKNSWLL